MQYINDFLKVVAFFYCFMGFTWMYYLAVMNLKSKLDTLQWFHKLWAYPAIFFFLVVDFVFNIIVGSISFLELPREKYFTARCARHIKSPGWRGKVAHFWCREFLNPFDPTGTHCGDA